MTSTLNAVIDDLVPMIEHLPREDQEYAAQQSLQGEEWDVVIRRVAGWLVQYQMEAVCEDAEAEANERDYR